jgi:hypothetical protein
VDSCPGGTTPIYGFAVLRQLRFFFVAVYRDPQMRDDAQVFDRIPARFSFTTRALQPTTDVLLSTRSLGEKSQYERNSLEFGLNRRSCVHIQIDVHIMAHQISYNLRINVHFAHQR